MLKRRILAAIALLLGAGLAAREAAAQNPTASVSVNVSANRREIGRAHV